MFYPVSAGRLHGLQLAHEVPMAGHLGKHKTAKLITQRFYWPTLYKDVEEFCRCCQTCQKSSKNRVARAPLNPVPIVTEPFQRLAMDIVGPLPRTTSGKRYVLVLCDYAMRSRSGGSESHRRRVHCRGTSANLCEGGDTRRNPQAATSRPSYCLRFINFYTSPYHHRLMDLWKDSTKLSKLC